MQEEPKRKQYRSCESPEGPARSDDGQRDRLSDSRARSLSLSVALESKRESSINRTDPQTKPEMTEREKYAELDAARPRKGHKEP
jgi:hypothetical protein